jgi:aromatic-L-amino-acid decarboxylase
MKPEEFRQWGYRFVDWVADYLDHPEDLRVLSSVEPGDIRKQLPKTAPEEGQSLDEVLQDLERVIKPGITHWNHPGFMAYFPNTGSTPGILGELVSAGLNVNGMLWRTSPAATELEETVLDWLRQMMGLPAVFKGMILDTASMSTFHALAAAREAVAEWNVREDGLSGPRAPRLRLYASEQAHSSVEKTAMALGLGRQGLVKIPVDHDFRMSAPRLEAAIQADLNQGLRPYAVVATVGTTSTTSIDPVPAIADICAKYRLWLHVDAAFAGSAAIVPEFRYAIDGCDRADSLVTNPHKWMLTPVDFSAFYFRRPEMLRKAFSLTPDYLQTAEGEAVTNYMDYGLPLGRRFRALKFWMVVRYYGVRGLQELIRNHVRQAQLFAALVAEDSRFELVAPVPFSTVCFRFKGDDTANQAIIDRVNASGRVFISHTRLHDRLTIRLAVGNARTTDSDIRTAWRLIQGAAQ